MEDLEVVSVKMKWVTAGVEVVEDELDDGVVRQDVGVGVGAVYGGVGGEV